MRHIFVRPTRPDEAQMYFNFATSTPDNLFDPAVAAYPSSINLCAYSQDGIILFAPVQQPFFMDALAFSPTSGHIDRAVAMKEVVQALVTQAHIKGIGEIYFYCKEPSTQAFAEKNGFEKINFPLYRMRLSDLEEPHDKV
jgi:hypothetical protein